MGCEGNSKIFTCKDYFNLIYSTNDRNKILRIKRDNDREFGKFIDLLEELFKNPELKQKFLDRGISIEEREKNEINNRKTS